MDRQIKARMIMHQMRPYGRGTRAQREAWTELVLGGEDLLPLTAHESESLEEEAGYLSDRTGGSIGGLPALLSDAAIGAIVEGHREIDRRLLEATATDYDAEEHHHTRAALSSGNRKRGLKRAQ